MKALLLLLISSPAFLMTSQTAEQAERLYDNAKTFLNAGKYKEALTDFENLINGYAQTDWAPKALLEMGNYYLNVEKEAERAVTYFSDIQQRYPGSAEAPAAYYYKALIADQEGESTADLEAAVADLIRMSNLFPDNQWRNGALFLFGKLSVRLKDYEQGLSYFQRLEFNFPKSTFLPQSLMLSAKAAVFKGDQQQGAMILARLQGILPDSDEAKQAESLLRLLDRLSHPKLSLDQTFFGGKPKKFSSPNAVLVDLTGRVAIRGQRSAYIGNLGSFDRPQTIPSKDLVTFCTDRNGNLVLVYKNRLVAVAGGLAYTSLGSQGNSLRDIRSAAIDQYGRLFVVDGNARDLWAFSKTGQYIKNFGMNRPKLVRCFGGEIWVLTNEGGLTHIDTHLNVDGGNRPNISSLTDFRFDPLGNFYTLSEKGHRVAVFSAEGRLLIDFNLKKGTYPLKQAVAIGVDPSGAIYLVDRRGGAVFRFF